MALNFPSGQPNGTVWTDPNGEQWVYNAAENSWTSKGLVNETGGLKYKGGLNITEAPPSAESGDFWSVETGGTAHAGFGPGLTGDIGTGSLILYDGTGWELINVDPSWVRTNGTITPVTPTDVIHGDSGVTVGPNDEIELNADGSASLAGGEVTIDSSGRLLAGTSSARTDLIAGTRGGRVQVEAASSTSADAIDNSSLCLTMGSSAPQGSANIFFTRTKSNSLGGVTSVGNNDILGGLYFQGTDGTDAVSAALIKAEVDGTRGANDMPGRLVFSTSANGAASPTQRMRIKSDGSVLIGGTLPSSPSATFNADGSLLVGATAAPDSETFAVDGSAAIENLNGSTVVSVDQDAAATITYNLRSKETGMMFISYAPSSTDTNWGSSGDGLYLCIYFGNLANTRANVITHDSGRASTTRDGAISVSTSGKSIIISKTAGTAVNSGDLSVGIVSGHRIKQPVVS